MTTVLRQVLQMFEQADAPLSVRQMARELDMTPAMLEGMLAHWVRRGKLRRVQPGQVCGTCGKATQCPLVAHLPFAYELVREGEPPLPACPRAEAPPPDHITT